MTYEESIQFLESLPRFTEKHTLEETRAFLDRLGAPDERIAERGAKIIHVAGTNGKGSVCNYLAEMFLAAGYRVALFTSPHLVDTRERIRAGKASRSGSADTYSERLRKSAVKEPTEREPGCDGLRDQDQSLPEIPQEDFVRLLERVMMECRCEAPGRKLLPLPSYFEMLFYIAELWFLEQRPDVVILETGLGGRLDATNAVRHKDACVITRIGYDHMQYLGNTLEAIAGEKAGILRSGVPAVTLSEPETAENVFRERAKELKTPLITVHPGDFRVRPGDGCSIDFSCRCRYDCKDFPGAAGPERVQKPDLTCIPAGAPGTSLTSSAGDSCEWLQAELRTPALYQGENAALAVAAAGIFPDMLTGSDIRRGLEHALWEGRMEQILPGVFLDGGHNPDGIGAFLRSVRGIPLPAESRRILLFSVVSDKQYEEMAEEILASGLFDCIVLAPLRGARALPAEKLEEAFSRASGESVVPKGAVRSSGIPADGRDPADRTTDLLGQKGQNKNDHTCSAAGQTTGCRIPGFKVKPRIVLRKSAEDAWREILDNRRSSDFVFAAGSLYLVGALKALNR